MNKEAANKCLNGLQDKLYQYCNLKPGVQIGQLAYFTDINMRAIQKKGGNVWNKQIAEHHLRMLRTSLMRAGITTL